MENNKKTYIYFISKICKYIEVSDQIAHPVRSLFFFSFIREQNFNMNNQSKKVAN